MKALTCTAARRRLQAFHDRELPITDQIAVDAHLEWCDSCAAELSELRIVGGALQAMAPGHAALSNEQAAVFTATVVNRLKAEEQASLFARVRGMFEDMHLVYAGLGAAAATAVCVVIMLGMMRFATSERPDSLAALVSLMASSPLECEMGDDLAVESSSCGARLAARFQRAHEVAELDAVFALESILTRQGRLATLEALRGRRASTGQAKLIEGMLDSLSRARFEAAQTLRVPDLAGMVWLVEHATVRANPNTKPALDLQLPPKKRAEKATAAARVARA